MDAMNKGKQLNIKIFCRPIFSSLLSISFWSELENSSFRWKTNFIKGNRVVQFLFISSEYDSSRDDKFLTSFYPLVSIIRMVCINSRIAIDLNLRHYNLRIFQIFMFLGLCLANKSIALNFSLPP